MARLGPALNRLRQPSFWLALWACQQGVAAELHELRLGSAVTLLVNTEPWQLEVTKDGGPTLRTALPRRLGFGRWVGADVTDRIYEGYSWRVGVIVDWYHVTNVRGLERLDPQTVVMTMNTSDPGGGVIDLTMRTSAQSPDVVSLDISAHGGSSRHANRLGMAWEAEQNEGYFGFGERFVGTVNAKGKDLYCWAEDGSWVLGREARLPKERSTYVPIPFMMSTRGFGIYVNTTWRTDWRLDSKELRRELELNDSQSAYEFKVETMSTTVVLLLGQTPAETLSLFTGPAVMPQRSLIPPKFQFGPWNQFDNEFGNTSYLEAIEKFAELDIPSSVAIDPVHFFPLGDQRGNEPKLMMRNARVASFGLATVSYFNSMLDQRFEPYYSECARKGLLLRRTDGSVYVFAYKGAGKAPFTASLLDFTNPEAVDWFQDRMQEALKLGYRGFMYDYGEYVSPNTRAFDGTSGRALHNAYPLQYQQAAFDFFKKHDLDPEDDFAPEYMYYVRSGYAGSQSVMWSHWTGDPFSGWDHDSGLGAQVKAMLSLGLSGVPFSGSDIGGFVWERPPSDELWLRWTAVGVVSGTMHTQTGGTPLLGKPKSHIHDTREGTRIYRKFAKLRTCLFPYLYTAAFEARSAGLPLMRHHLLSFPHDPKAWSQSYQFMLGPSLLVAPVVTKGTQTQTVYLPKAEHGWIDVWSGLAYDELDGRFRISGNEAIRDSGQTVTVAAPLDAIPVFVRAGTILVTLDPAVDTLNVATHVNVTSYHELQGVVHVWVWPDENMTAQSGKLWDAAVFSLDRGEGQGEVVFTAADTEMARTVVAQVALNGRRVKGVRRLGMMVEEIKQAEVWRDLVSLWPPQSMYAVDREQGTLWLRMAPGVHQFHVQLDT